MKAMFRGMVAAALVISATGCAQAGALGDIVGGVLNQGTGAGGGNANEVVAEVQAVDANRGILQVRTQNGQVGNVYFDQNTQVIYQQQRYSPTALERGDVVSLRVQQDQRGNAYTDYILVRQSVQDRGGTSASSSSPGTYSGAVQRFSGTVGYIDAQRGIFELRTQNGSAQVALPYGVSAQDDQRFRSLRSGQGVTLDGRTGGQGRIELVRFY
jgi:hypothetical protein